MFGHLSKFEMSVNSIFFQNFSLVNSKIDFFVKKPFFAWMMFERVVIFFGFFPELLFTMLKILNFFRIYGHLKFTQVSKHAEKVIFFNLLFTRLKNLEIFWIFSKKVFLFFKFLFFTVHSVKTGQTGSKPVNREGRVES